MAVRANRLLDRLFRALGADQTARTASVQSDQVLATYQIDDLKYSLPNATSTRLSMSLIPSSAAGVYSFFELIPKFGCWVRAAWGTAGNWSLGKHLGALSGITVADALNGISVLVATPYGGDFKPGSAALSQLVDPGTSGYPTLFSAAQVGRGGVGLPGVLIVANDPQRHVPFWVNPGEVFRGYATAVNTVIVCKLDLEFPSENNFAP